VKYYQRSVRTNRKSATCMGKVSQVPLTEYGSRFDAMRGAAYVEQEYGRHMVPYECVRCQCWHLTPEERHTPSDSCGECLGRDGRAKSTYWDRAAAERRADITWRENGVQLRVYPCPVGAGWHLTKRDGCASGFSTLNGASR
jgi:hypothetical protein